MHHCILYVLVCKIWGTCTILQYFHSLEQDEPHCEMHAVCVVSDPTWVHSPSGPQACWYNWRWEASSSSSAQEESSQNSASVTPGECWSWDHAVITSLSRLHRLSSFSSLFFCRFTSLMALLYWRFTGDEDFMTRLTFFTRFQTVYLIISVKLR